MLGAKEKNDVGSVTPLFPKLKEHNLSTKCILPYENYKPIWKKDQNEKKWFDENFLYLLPIGSAAGGGNTSIMADFVSS